jgi:ubiquitin-protein ligase
MNIESDMNSEDENTFEPFLDIVNMEECKSVFLNRLKREWLHLVSCDKSIASGLLKYINNNKEILFELKTKETKETKETKKTNTIYKFILPITYPFSPPKILINDRPYIYTIQMPSTRFTEILKEIEGKNCLCCDSQICYSNWGPAITIPRLIKEIEYNKNIMKRIVKYILLRTIKKKYLIMDIPIEKYL